MYGPEGILTSACGLFETLQFQQLPPRGNSCFPDPFPCSNPPLNRRSRHTKRYAAFSWRAGRDSCSLRLAVPGATLNMLPHGRMFSVRFAHYLAPFESLLSLLQQKIPAQKAEIFCTGRKGFEPSVFSVKGRRVNRATQPAHIGFVREYYQPKSCLSIPVSQKFKCPTRSSPLLSPYRKNLCHSGPRSRIQKLKIPRHCSG